MRTRLAVFALLLAVTSPLHADSDSTSVVTRTGKSYHQCKVIKVSPDGVTFRHSKGIAKVLFVDMNEAAQERYGYDPAKVRAYEAKVKEDREKARVAAAQAAAARAKALAEARQRWLETQTLLSIQQSAQLQAVAAQQSAGGAYWYIGDSGYYDGHYGYGYGSGYHGHGYHYGKDCGPRQYSSSYFTHPVTASIVGTYASRNGVHLPCVTAPAYRGHYTRPSGNVSLSAHYGALVRPNLPVHTGVYGRSTGFTSAPHVRAPVIQRTTMRAYRHKH